MERSAGREPSEGTRRALLEEVKGLFGPAFGPALAAYGRPFAELIGRDRRFRAEARDVKTAILKDVEGLTHVQIGERLGIPPPTNYSYKGDHAAVRKMVGRGRRFMTAGLGDEGYATHVRAMKQEAGRRRA